MTAWPTTLTQSGASSGMSPRILSGTVSVTSNVLLFMADMSGLTQISVQVTSAGGTCTITYEESNDGATWIAAAGFVPATPATETATTSTTAGSMVFRTTHRYFRARVSTYTSGTVTVFYYASGLAVQVAGV